MGQGRVLENRKLSAARFAWARSKLVELEATEACEMAARDATA